MYQLKYLGQDKIEDFIKLATNRNYSKHINTRHILDWNIIQNIGYIFGIIGTAYGIMMRRKLFLLQRKSEQAKTSAYRARKKAEDARKTKHTIETVKLIWDSITGNKRKDSGEMA